MTELGRPSHGSVISDLTRPTLDVATRDTRGEDAVMKRGAHPTTRYVKTDDGIHIGYQLFGEGSYDIVLNDGWMTNVDANWDLPMYGRFLSKLGERARVVMFDRRGFGISDRPSSLESMSLEKGMDDMRTVMDAAECERAVVYGFEDGCAVSLLFAASYPERTRALILATPLVSYFTSSDFPWGGRRTSPRNGRTRSPPSGGPSSSGVETCSR